MNIIAIALVIVAIVLAIITLVQTKLGSLLGWGLLALGVAAFIFHASKVL